jgi:hypothetical protein
MKHCLWLIVLAGWLMPPALAADPAPRADKKSKSTLDEQLLKGLGDDPVTEDLLPKKRERKDASRKSPDEDQPARRPTESGGNASRKAEENSLDKQLLEGLGDGEDIGESGDPLARLGQRMRQAGGLIGETKSGEPTQQLQKKIVADLEYLIKMARQQQQQQQQSSSSSQQTARRQQVKQSKPGSKPGERQQDQPARDSTERLGKNDVRRPDMAQMNDVIKRVWGQLPEKEREQMLQNSVDQFLPKYELLIEAYFKSLVERQQESSRK